MPIEGANVFLSDVDATTPPDANGDRLIQCHQLSTSEELRLAYRGFKLLQRIIGGVPLPE